MGCDIHAYVEVFDEKNGIWVSPQKWVANVYTDTDDGEGEVTTAIDTYAQYAQLRADTEDTRTHMSLSLARYQDAVLRERNYALFGILAGVRGDEFPQITAQRGLPGDASWQVAACAEGWDGDGHSHSWLTLADLLQYDWSQEIEEDYPLGAGDYVDFMRIREYSPYATPNRGVNREFDARLKAVPGDLREPPYDGPHFMRAATITIEEMEATIEAIRESCYGPHAYPSPSTAHHHEPFDRFNLRLAQAFSDDPIAQVKCPATLAMYADELWKHTIPKMASLAAQQGPSGNFCDGVRLVFWFDN